jgi:hypothetical protein
MVLLVTPADRASFGRCRRQWDFGARCRQNLEAVSRPAVPDLAAALREALAVYYFPGMWDWQRSITLPLVIQGFEREMDRQRSAAGAVGAVGAAGAAPDETAWAEDLRTGRDTLGRYFAWAPEVDTFSPVLVETEYEANVPSPADPHAGLVTAGGEAVTYRGKLHMLAVDAHDAYWVVRHRLVTGPWPPTGDLLADTEMLTACWAWEQFYLGMAIEGVIYNELRPAGDAPPPAAAVPPPPAAPGPPPRRRGWLRRRAGSAAHRAGSAAHRVGQSEPSGGGRSIPQHRRMYAVASQPERLDPVEQRATGDFRRTWLRRSRAEVAGAGQQLARDAADMTSGPSIYPEPALDSCPACAFLDPCLAMFAGQDPEPILASSYRDRPADVPLEGRIGGRAWGVGRGAAPPRFGGRR